MIEIKGLTKSFDKLIAVNNLSLNLKQGTVTGLVGSNGSGKSTLLRLLAGVYRADGGTIEINGEQLFDNPRAKGDCFFIPDFPYFYNNSTVNSTAYLYRQIYPNWDEKLFNYYCSVFPIRREAKIIDMSKGMQRQAALILALSTAPKYLFLDEIFDGLDPVVRFLLKKILINHVAEHEMTVIIASHNLRELEDMCDHICLMHKGMLLMERELEELKSDYGKVQIAFPQVPEGIDLFAGINVVNLWRNGNIFNVTIRGKEEEFMPQLNALSPSFVAAMPLTLEEIFISEMGAAGYDVNSII